MKVSTFVIGTRGFGVPGTVVEVLVVFECIDLF